MRTLVLASTSPYRRRLFKQLGVPFLTAAPRCHEEIQPGIAPELLVKHLSLQKAESLAPQYDDALIIGSDQVFVDPRNRVIGKPGSSQRAFEQLKSMSGRSHTFFTGVCLHDSARGESQVDYATFTVTLRKLSDDEIRSYIRREEPTDCAGSFKVEGLGIALMESMGGEDYTALVGLPLIKLCGMLRQAGVELL
ncbi:MAG: septum formation protein Maf [Desulfuromonas sp.]|nr:MAG: septum formation protein Maf [Desulfuromonas sp.]